MKILLFIGILLCTVTMSGAAIMDTANPWKLTCARLVLVAIHVTRVKTATTANIARSRVGHAAFANVDRGFIYAGLKYWEILGRKLTAAGWT